MIQLADRWRRARRAGLDGVATGPDDDALLERALAADAEAAQRRVFDNSRRLGESFRRFHRAALELGDLPMALAEIGATVPCLQGTWRPVPDEDALVLERTGCPAGAGGARACDWWREAISGLVQGMTEGLRHTRHDSRGHGGDRCVDVVHRDPQSRLRFGPIPAELVAPLEAVARTLALFDSTAPVTFLGVSEGVLYYQLAPAGCSGGVRVQPALERAVHRRWPDLRLCEVTPRSVLIEP